MDIAQAAGRFVDGSLDVIYLDANHTYEFVLRDLYTWFPKLRRGGLFSATTSFSSPLGAQQNIGVIPAFLTFSKRFETYPVALSSSDWSDFYFSNEPTSHLIAHLKTPNSWDHAFLSWKSPVNCWVSTITNWCSIPDKQQG